MNKINVITMIVLPNAVKNSDTLFFDVIDYSAEHTNILSVGGFQFTDATDQTYNGTPFLSITTLEKSVVETVLNWLHAHKDDNGEPLYAALTVDYSYTCPDSDSLALRASIAAEKVAVTEAIKEMVKVWAEGSKRDLGLIEVQLDRVAPAIKHKQ